MWTGDALGQPPPGEKGAAGAVLCLGIGVVPFAPFSPLEESPGMSFKGSCKCLLAPPPVTHSGPVPALPEHPNIRASRPAQREGLTQPEEPLTPRPGCGTMELFIFLKGC